MEINELIRLMRSPTCEGCPIHRECENGEIGCFLVKEAADMLDAQQKQIIMLEEAASAEKQACFRLGQMDVRESVVSMLQEAADHTYGIAHSTLLIAVDLVKGDGAHD